MFRNTFSLGITFLLAGALLLAAPGVSRAQRGGRGGAAHVGAFHGLAHVGGGFNHVGGFHGGFHHVGGFRGGFGYGSYWGYRSYYPFYGGYNYFSPYLYGGYGYSPYYGSYSYSPYLYGPYGYAGAYDYGSYSFLGYGNTYDSGYYGAYSGQAPSYGDSYPSLASSGERYAAYSPTKSDTDGRNAAALIAVNVPADAHVWLDDAPTTATGSRREFASPPLTPRIRYSYEIRARWTDNGREVTQARKVTVTAGDHVEVTFPLRPNTTEQIVAHHEG
jgi:uncharacterized protein (TIGR03000 family)